MTLYETKFWNALDGARIELSGSSFYDHETDIHYNTPAKDKKKYAKAYEYCYTSIDTFIKLADTIEEIKLIKSQIQHSQDFALQNKEFTTDFILNFSYKNWIIRINIIAEQLIFFVNHVYRLNLQDKDLINKIFEHTKVKDNRDLYFALLNLVDFLKEKILLKANNKSLKRARNEIVHNAYFQHDTISNLSTELFAFKMGISDKIDEEDLYLEEGQASEKIKNEILDFSRTFLEKYLSLYSLFTVEFSKNFNSLLL